VTEQLRSLIERPIKETDAEPFKLVKKVRTHKTVSFFFDVPAWMDK
jgi:hypothetical protein